MAQTPATTDTLAATGFGLDAVTAIGFVLVAIGTVLRTRFGAPIVGAGMRRAGGATAAPGRHLRR